jgi:hypothetical protein
VADRLIVMTNTDRGFYPMLGPYLARREVVAQVGGMIWDEDTKTWLVLADGRKVRGFVGVTQRQSRRTMESLWLADPTYRRVAEELIGAAVDRFGGENLYATVIRKHVAAYLSAGFEQTGETKEFIRLTRRATP